MAPKVYEQVLRESKVAAAYANRQEALGSLGVSIDKLDNLKSLETIPFNRFNRLKHELQVKMEKLGDLQSAFHKAVLLSEPQLQGTDEVKKDLINIEELIDSCKDSLDECKERDEIKDAMKNIKPESVPSEISSVLSDIKNNQHELINNLVTSLSIKQRENMQTVVTNLSTALTSKQTENIEKLVKTNSSAAPKPIQPIFTSR